MGQKINVIRGTTCKFDIQLKDESGEFYRLKDGEVLRFGIKDKMELDKTLITKQITAADINEDGDAYTLHITPEDTEHLDLRRYYYYDVGLQSGNDYYNVIPCSDFALGINITSKEKA